MIRVILFLLLSHATFAQSKYWVFFTDKNHEQAIHLSDKTFKNRANLGLELYQETDRNLSPDYLSLLKKSGIEIQNKSKWLNAISAELTPMQIAVLKSFPFVKSIQPINGYFYTCKNEKVLDTFYMHFALNQMHAESFIGNGLLADSVDIGVLDGGFYNAHINQDLTGLFKNIKQYRDYISPNKKDFFGEKESDSDFHGTLVLTALGGRKDNQFYGLASNANYYLARTESGKKESRMEEDNWIAAVEWMDSLGVRLVNSSLGYTNGFTNPAENHLASEMNGETSTIAKAAKIAVEQKGMILVVSAGNEGRNDKWGRVVSTPADVKSVITIGANDSLGLKMDYSSIGTDIVKFNKPDFTSYSQIGTSFSAPIITGFIAVLLQLKPDLKLDEIKEIMAKSAFNYPFYNNFIGYGFPDAQKCLDLLIGQDSSKTYKTIEVKSDKYEWKEAPIAIFHKKDASHVISQMAVLKEAKVLLRPKEVNYSTLIYQNSSLEIHWKD